MYIEAPGASAFNHCVEGNYEAARSVLECISAPDLKALRQGCVDLDNEINCLIETVVNIPKRKNV